MKTDNQWERMSCCRSPDGRNLSSPLQPTLQGLMSMDWGLISLLRCIGNGNNSQLSQQCRICRIPGHCRRRDLAKGHGTYFGSENPVKKSKNGYGCSCPPVEWSQTRMKSSTFGTFRLLRSTRSIQVSLACASTGLLCPRRCITPPEVYACRSTESPLFFCRCTSRSFGLTTYGVAE